MTQLEGLRAETAGKKVLYIIPCCAEKNPNGTFGVAPEGRVPTEAVNADLWVRIYQARRDCLDLLPESPPRTNMVNQHINPDGSDFNPTQQGKAAYRPAWDRYNGNLYKVPGVKALLKKEDSGVMIVSSLYGLISPHDLIQDYNITMIKSWRKWERVLPDAIDDFASRNGFDMIVGLFSETGGDNRIFRARRGNAGVPFYMVHPKAATCGSPMILVPRGMGHALLYLASNGQYPDSECDYDVNRIR